MTDEQKIDAVTAALLPWGNWADELAWKEGWVLSETAGSAYGPWQIQKLDDAPDGCVQLQNDDEAHRIVREGTGAHHIAAREFLRIHNPSEWAYINGSGKI